MKCLTASIILLGLALAANAQTASLGEINFSGLIDGYYSLNFNHPASQTNQLRNFDVKANQFSLNMAKVTLEHPAEPVGFRLDLGFGRAFEMVHAAEQAPSVFRNIEQAYISYKPAGGKGLQIDFGKHVTMAGAEVIETNSNWNYSRSLLFSWAIPYYHFGLRTSMPVGSHFTAGFHLVNGWNNVEDNNSGKTVGLTGALTAGPVTWSNNYYAGPEKTSTNQGWRHLYDTTLLVNGSKAGAYFNFDYGIDRNPGARGSAWYGVAGAARYAFTTASRRFTAPGVVQRPRRLLHRRRAEVEGVHANRRVQDGGGVAQPPGVPARLVQPAILRARRHAGRLHEPGHPAGGLCCFLWTEVGGVKHMGSNSTQALGVTIFLASFVLIAAGMAMGGSVFLILAGLVLLGISMAVFLKAKPLEHEER